MPKQGALDEVAHAAAQRAPLWQDNTGTVFGEGAAYGDALKLVKRKPDELRHADAVSAVSAPGQ